MPGGCDETLHRLSVICGAIYGTGDSTGRSFDASSRSGRTSSTSSARMPRSPSRRTASTTFRLLKSSYAVTRLAAAGMLVLRFPNAEILLRSEAVLERIRAALRARLVPRFP